MCPGALAAGRAGGRVASVFGVSDPLSWRDGGILSGVQQPIYACFHQECASTIPLSKRIVSRNRPRVERRRPTV
jgi:hypothetical protein